MAVEETKHTLSLIVWVCVVALALMFFQGCDGPVRSAFPPPPQLPPVSSPDSSVPVDILYDATPSLEGFLAGARYRTLVGLALANAAPPSTSPCFYRVSDQSYQRFKSPVRAGKSDFYFGNTDLGVALDSARAGRLTVIVTDLFQTDQDMSRLGDTLAQKFLEKGQAVGVAGLRLNFDGKVYDVGMNRRTFDYSGERPLYLLLLGPHRDVEAYLHRLGKAGFAPKRLIFSGHLMSNPVSMESAQVENYQNLVQDVFFRKTRPGQYVLEDPQEEQHFVELLLPVDPLPFVVPFQRASVSAHVQRVMKQRNGQVDTVTAGVTAGNEKLVESTFEGDNLRVRLAVDPVDLSGRGIYRFDVVLRPDSIKLPPWTRSWDMDLTKVSSWSDSTFEGETTQHLHSFLNTLWQDTKAQKPQLGWLTLYVRRE